MSIKLAAAAAAMLTVSGVAMAGSDHSVRGEAASLAQAHQALDALESVAESLTVDQRQALDGIRGRSATEVWSQVDDILTPVQRVRFDGAVETLMAREEVSPTDEGGYYLPYGCFLSSKAGLLFSVVGFIGCPGDNAREATILSWGASIFSSSCLLDGASECDAAVTSAEGSLNLWSQLLTTCSVADSAYYSELVTYRSCGGVKGGSPTPEPTPDATPTLEAPTASPDI